MTKKARMQSCIRAFSFGKAGNGASRELASGEIQAPVLAEIRA